MSELRLAWLAAIAIAAAFLGMLAVAAFAHDIYHDWQRPDGGGSCCSGHDCYVTASRFQGGQWWALRREDQAWVPIPPSKVLTKQQSPDGKAHLCASPSLVFCFLPPDSGA